MPFVNQDWSSTKAADRFLSNDGIGNQEAIFWLTQERYNFDNGPVLILHDTTKFSFKRKEVTEVGFTRLAIVGKYSAGSSSVVHSFVKEKESNPFLKRSIFQSFLKNKSFLLL
ncbi:transposase [Leptospira borgpetersenii]|uniref:transposase n=1 Tax=Leptospira borgpetersenii TaxID=174 RepID=UPI001E4FD710